MQWTPYTLPVAATGVMMAWAGGFILTRRRQTPAAVEFVVMIAAMVLNAFAYAIELAASSLDVKLAMLSARWLGSAVLPAAQLVFALRWGGHHGWRSPARIALLVGVPLVFLAAAWTNEWHEWVATRSVLVARDGFVMRHAESRWAFWVFVLYAYGCLMASTAIYLRAIHASPLHRKQGLVLLLATFVPWLANALYVAGHAPDPDLDVSVFGYAGAACLWAFGLSRSQLLDVAPIARAQVFDGLADAVIVVGPQGRVIDWNPAAAQLFGRRGDDVAGLAVEHLVGPHAAQRIEAREPAFELAIAGRTFALDVAPLRGGDHARAAIVTLRDVSEQNRVALAREEALRTAESVARARAEFLARTSHEVRTPLHAIVGAADLLSDAELDGAARRYVAAVASSSRALVAVVDDLLELVKLDADCVRLHVADLDASETLREVAALFAGAADRAGIALVIEAGGPLPMRADASRLRQVLVNLVGNALKLTERGSITLRASARGDTTRIEVIDTGPGLPEDARARIFEPFVQLDAGGGGTGLGLPISRRLVASMDGEIGVDTRLGEGSTFWIELPTAARVRTSLAASPTPRATGARRGRVLVVDDVEVSRFITGALLEREGCTVDTADGVARALELVGEAEYDLVLTDLRMPEGGGVELARAIRSRADARAATPLVALTADASSDAERQARDAGMQDWLLKPIDPARLREMLDRFAPAASPEAAPMSVSDLLGSQPELRERVLHAFHRSAPLEIEAIGAAAERGDWALAREHAHALHGAASIVGARELAALCLELAEGSSPAVVAGRLAPAYSTFAASCLDAPEPLRA